MGGPWGKGGHNIFLSSTPENKDCKLKIGSFLNMLVLKRDQENVFGSARRPKVGCKRIFKDTENKMEITINMVCKYPRTKKQKIKRILEYKAEEQ